MASYDSLIAPLFAPLLQRMEEKFALVDPTVEGLPSEVWLNGCKSYLHTLFSGRGR